MEQDKLIEFIKNSDKPILFDICGTAYPIKNNFYKTYLNKEFSLEVPNSLIREIENSPCKKEFVKEDGYSKSILVCPINMCEECNNIF